MSKSLLFLVVLCLSTTVGLTQQVKLERSCFNTKWEDWGLRIIGDKLYCLSASFDCDSTMLDPHTLKPFSDLYLIKGCSLEYATFSTKSFGEHTSMSSNFYDGPVSGNNKVLFFTNNHGEEQNVRLGIFYAFNIKNKWSDALVFPFNSSEYNVSHPYYDEKNGKLYFVSDKGAVEKNHDIYSCTFDGSHFGPVSKLEKANSSFNELAPYIYKDTLYFTSNGYNSMGGYDMYKLVNGKVVSMGPDFNSIYDDLALFYDSDSSGYFTSDRYSKGADDDIVRFVVSKTNESQQMATEPKDTLPELATIDTKEAIKKLVATKNQIDSLKFVATTAGVSPDLFAFLNMALAQYEKDFPESMEGKTLEEINTKIAELVTVITLINQQIDIVDPKQPTNTKLSPTISTSKDFATTKENNPITLDILANDSIGAGNFDLNSIDLDPTTPGIQQHIVNEQGTWQVKNGKVTFEPNDGFNGFANITYVVSDKNGNLSNTGLITVDVLPVIEAPIAENDFTETKANKSVTIPATQNDKSVEGQLDLTTLDLEPNTPGQQLTVTNNQGFWSVKDGKITFKPNQNFKGAAIVSYSIKNDAGIESNVANVTVTVSPESVASAVKVIANNDVATTKQGQPVDVMVLLNDIDPEGALDYTSIDLEPSVDGIQKQKRTEQGNWTVNQDKVTFTPLPTFVGKANLTTYTVNNKTGIVSNVATISIDVLEVVSAPVAQNNQQTAKQGQPTILNIESHSSDHLVSIDLTSIDLDPSTPGLQQTITNAQGTWTVENGNVKFEAAAGFSGNATIPYTVNNINGTLSNVALLSVEVPAVQLPTNAGNIELSLINSIIDQSKIENIHFEFDKYAITPEYQKYLRGLSMLFSANPTWQIHLSGHTDSLGSDEYNIALSKNRSESTKQFLMSCGIVAERITYEYHGEEIHIATNSTPEGRYQNRRVEIAVSINGKLLYDTGVPK